MGVKSRGGSSPLFGISRTYVFFRGRESFFVSSPNGTAPRPEILLLTSGVLTLHEEGNARTRRRKGIPSATFPLYIVLN